MPFTGSHPAAVIPLARWGLPASGLVIGSITPDLPMFAPIPVDIHYTHSLLGVISIDLVMGGFAFVLWQALVGPAMVSVAPTGLRRRLRKGLPAGLGFHFGAWVRALLVAASIAVGALTHVVWDSFTHGWMWGARQVPWLTEQQGPFKGYEWAQHVSGAMGLALIFAWIWRWWRRSPMTAETVPAASRSFTIFAWLMILVPAAIGFVYGLVWGESPEGHLFLAVVYSGGLGAAGSMVAACWQRIIMLR
jgi:hypothetical protein